MNYLRIFYEKLLKKIKKFMGISSYWIGAKF
jgi:hypothetical protein